MDKAFLGHSHFVNCLLYVHPTEQFPQGVIISGSNDKTINVYDVTQPQDPVFTMLGHTDAIVSLALNVTSEGTDIVSASWDKSAKVWRNYQDHATLSGHAFAVWAVLGLGERGILTGEIGWKHEVV
ncbi:hypothetical protein HK101_006054 [Irineochytrium annulatum]|nr:hypothetical protein HK101_006054 [Irineochytrium annulatum]